MSGRQDSNLRPPGPKPGALTGLRYAPKYHTSLVIPKIEQSRPVDIISFASYAVGGGFEPPVPFPVRQFSKLLV